MISVSVFDESHSKLLCSCRCPTYDDGYDTTMLYNEVVNQLKIPIAERKLFWLVNYKNNQFVARNRQISNDDSEMLLHLLKKDIKWESADNVNANVDNVNDNNRCNSNDTNIVNSNKKSQSYNNPVRFTYVRVKQLKLPRFRLPMRKFKTIKEMKSYMEFELNIYGNIINAKDEDLVIENHEYNMNLL